MEGSAVQRTRRGNVFRHANDLCRQSGKTLSLCSKSSIASLHLAEEGKPVALGMTVAPYRVRFFCAIEQN